MSDSFRVYVFTDVGNFDSVHEFTTKDSAEMFSSGVLYGAGIYSSAVTYIIPGEEDLLLAHDKDGLDAALTKCPLESTNG